MSESDINRRAMLARLGLTATAIYTVPAITTLSAAHASSPSGESEDSSDDGSTPSEDDVSTPSEDDTSSPSSDDSAEVSSTCGTGVVGAVCK